VAHVRLSSLGAFHLIKLLFDEHAMFILERRSSTDLIADLRSRCKLDLQNGKPRIAGDVVVRLLNAAALRAFSHPSPSSRLTTDASASPSPARPPPSSRIDEQDRTATSANNVQDASVAPCRAPASNASYMLADEGGKRSKESPNFDPYCSLTLQISSCIFLTQRRPM
jgi:hypothetical protein